jgi:hypothetical protein
MARAKQNRHRAQAAQRGRHGEIAGTRPHQDGDRLTPSNAATNQTPNEVVDSSVRLRVRKCAPLPEEESAIRIGSGLLREDEP